MHPQKGCTVSCQSCIRIDLMPHLCYTKTSQILFILTFFNVSFKLLCIYFDRLYSPDIESLSFIEEYEPLPLLSL